MRFQWYHYYNVENGCSHKLKYSVILGVVKRNPLFFHSISSKNNGFLFTTPNIKMYIFNI